MRVSLSSKCRDNNNEKVETSESLRDKLRTPFSTKQSSGYFQAITFRVSDLIAEIASQPSSSSDKFVSLH